MEFVRDELRQALHEILCQHCGSRGADATVEREGPHFARLTCQACFRFLDWLAWPKDAPQRDRKRSRRALERIGGDHCAICLRIRFQIPPPDDLQVHHIIPVEDGGTDHPDNLQHQCSACHKLVHWARTYFGHYHPDAA